MIGYRPLDLPVFVLIMAVWGGNFAVVKWGLEQFSPFLFMALRFLIVALVLLPFVPRPKGKMLQVFLISITLGFLHFALMFTAIQTIDVATAAIAIQLQVPFASLLAFVFLKDRLGWRRAAGMAIAFTGVVLIAGEPRLEGQYLALAMVIGGAFMWSIANLQIKLLGDVNGASLNAWVALFAAPQILVASLLLEEGQVEQLLRADYIGWSAVLYQSLAVVVFGYGIWYRLLRRYDLNQAMPFMLLVPVFGVASGLIFLGERLTLPLILGGLLTVAGVAIIVLRRPRLAGPKTGRL